MAAVLRFSARKVCGRALQQATAAVKEEQQWLLPRLIPGADGRMPFLRSFSSAGAPNNAKHDHLPHAKPIADVDLARIPASIRPQVKAWYNRNFPLAKPIVDVESSISNKEPASLRAQVEEKKKEVVHLLFQLKFGSESETGGEKPNLEDKRILDELPPFREVKEIVDNYEINLIMKRLAITYVLGMTILVALNL